MEKGSGTRSGLLWEVERILYECDELPQVLLMENVPQVHNKKNMADFEQWINSLKQLGYTSFWQDLNAKDYGIPQNRNRCFMVSILGDYTYEFPKPFPLEKRLKDMLEEEVDEKYYLSDEQIERIKASTYNQNKTRIQEKDWCDTLCARDYKDPKCVSVARKYGIFDDEKHKHQAGSVYCEEGLAPTLDTMQGGYRQPCIEERECLLIKNATKKGYLEAYEGDGIDISSRMEYHRGTVQSGIIQTLDTQQTTNEEISQCLTEPHHNSQRLFDGLRIRKLTPKECWRLMGFDDKDYEKAVKVNSNTQLYKQAGNSIVVNVLEEIFKQIL